MIQRIILIAIFLGLGLWLAAAPDSQIAVAANAKQSALAKEAAAPGKAETPAFLEGGESLNYSLKWPGGVSFGEAHLRASRNASGWQFDFTMDASVPGFVLSDHYRSHANAEFCSLELEKQTTHGSRKTHEKTVFDYEKGSATRTTLLIEGGGHTDVPLSSCAHDGLDFVYYARRELAEGRGIPQAQDVLFGASYSVRMAFAGVQDVTVAGKRRLADHVVLYVKGPASDSQLDLFFERNAARTPLLIKAPLPVGTLSMELER